MLCFKVKSTYSTSSESSLKVCSSLTLLVFTGRCNSFEMSIEDYINKNREYRKAAKRKAKPQSTIKSTPVGRPTTVKRRRQLLQPPLDTKAVAPGPSAQSLRRNCPKPPEDITKPCTPADSSIPCLPTGATSSPRKKTFQQVEGWAKKRELVATKNRNIEHFHDLPYIHWGGSATDPCGTSFTNTCTLDNFMMIMVYSYYKNLKWREYVDKPRTVFGEQLHYMMSLLCHPQGPKTNAARRHWVWAVQGVQPEKNMDLKGFEDEKFLKYFKNLSADYEVVRTCRCGHRSTHSFDVSGQSNGNVYATVNNINEGGWQVRCPDCNTTMRNYVTKPPTDRLLPVIVMGICSPIIKIHHIPETIDILGDEYTLFACSLQTKGPGLAHYLAAFRFNNNWFTYNGMTPRITSGKPPHDEVSTVWYQLGSR